MFHKHTLIFFCFSDFYEAGAILMEDEGAVIAGLLVGLNVIDCNMCIKEQDLDQPVSQTSCNSRVIGRPQCYRL